MAAREILIWPDPILLKKSKPVQDFDKNLQIIIRDLKDTMNTEPMAGLSAPQIGENIRLFSVDIDPKDNDGNGTDGQEFFINPEIISSKDYFTWEEGCMSVPGFRGSVKRSDKITLRYQNPEGKILEREAFGYLSGCFQHELDHLNGILWVDYQKPAKKNFIKKKMLKLRALNI